MKAFVEKMIKRLELSEILTISDNYTFSNDRYFIVEIPDDPSLFKNGDILDDRILQLLDIMDTVYEGYEDTIPFEVIADSEGFAPEWLAMYNDLNDHCSYCGTIATYECYSDDGTLRSKVHFIAKHTLVHHIDELKYWYSLLSDNNECNNDTLDKYLINRWVEYGY